MPQIPHSSAPQSTETRSRTHLNTSVCHHASTFTAGVNSFELCWRCHLRLIIALSSVFVLSDNKNNNNNNNTVMNSQLSRGRYFACVKSDGCSVLTTSTFSLSRIDAAALCALHCHVCVASFLESKKKKSAFVSVSFCQILLIRMRARDQKQSLAYWCCGGSAAIGGQMQKWNWQLWKAEDKWSIRSPLRKKKEMHMYAVCVPFYLRKPKRPAARCW